MMGFEKVVFVGDSHLNAIRRAAKNSKFDLPHLTFLNMGTTADLMQPFFSEANGNIRIDNAAMRSRLGTLCDTNGQLVFDDSTLYIFSLGLHTNCLLTGEPWLSHAPWQTQASKSRCAISTGHFQDIVLELNRHLLEFLTLAMESMAQMMVLAAPPPSRRFFLFDIGFCETDVLFMDQFVRRVMRASIEDLSIRVEDPPSLSSVQGFLRLDLQLDQPDDRHHGSVGYGRAVLGQLFRYHIAQWLEAIGAFNKTA